MYTLFYNADGSITSNKPLIEKMTETLGLDGNLNLKGDLTVSGNIIGNIQPSLHSIVLNSAIPNSIFPENLIKNIYNTARIQVEMIGGGGGGGRCLAKVFGGGGGGAGGYLKFSMNLVNVDDLNKIQYTIGAGGIGNSGNKMISQVGGAGGNTSIKFNNFEIIASGGNGGGISENIADLLAPGGLGGVNNLESVDSTIFEEIISINGGDGANGGPGTQIVYSGHGGSSFFGGGSYGTSFKIKDNSNLPYGAGGGGSINQDNSGASNGGHGIIIITYIA